MSEVLYRKYRPKAFSDVYGQEQLITVLQRSIKEKSFGHAYLFSGGRGTGKTTIARIFASEIGCKPIDFYEIDAASNTGIDEIRDLREAVKTMPFESPFKVYILDEVHMLSKAAFNALLKTLEEPPAHVVFILATTEKEKVPDTIVSRCQAFTFRQPTVDELKKYIELIAKKEGLKIDGPGAEIIAMFGDGSYRDTLSVLEKVVMGSSTKVLSYDAIAEIIGAPSGSLVNDVIRSVASGELEVGLEAIRQAREEHLDMRIYLKMILQKMRAVLLLRYAPNIAKEFDEEFTPDDLVLLRSYANDEQKRINSHVLNDFLGAYDQLGYTVISSLPVELVLIRTIGERSSKT